MAYWCDSCGREVSEYTGDPRMCGKCGDMAVWRKAIEVEAKEY